MARLGLTCKDAFVVFSQNETLKLQKQVKELETRLAKYEPEPRFFESEQIWEDVRDEADAVLRDWIQKNVTVPETVDYVIWDLCWTMRMMVMHSERRSFKMLTARHKAKSFRNVLRAIV